MARNLQYFTNVRSHSSCIGKYSCVRTNNFRTLFRKKPIIYLRETLK